MKKRLLLGAGLLGVFGLSALVHMPASFVYHTLGQYAAIPAQLRVDGIQGTLWQGRAAQVRWQRYDLGAVNWSLDIGALFSGRLQAQVRVGQGGGLVVGRGTLGLNRQGAFAQNVVASLSVEQILPWLPRPPVPLDVQGQVEFNIQHWDYQAPWCRSAKGSVVLNTQGVGTPIAELTTGPVVAPFTCQDSALSVAGNQQSDQVESAFTLDLTPDRRYQTRAWFTPQSNFPPALQEQLKWLPAPTDGKYAFEYGGRW